MRFSVVGNLKRFVVAVAVLVVVLVVAVLCGEDFKAGRRLRFAVPEGGPAKNKNRPRCGPVLLGSALVYGVRLCDA